MEVETCAQALALLTAMALRMAGDSTCQSEGEDAGKSVAISVLLAHRQLAATSQAIDKLDEFDIIHRLSQAIDCCQQREDWSFQEQLVDHLLNMMNFPKGAGQILRLPRHAEQCLRWMLPRFIQGLQVEKSFPPRCDVARTVS